MDSVRYCTTEWLEKCLQRYPDQPRFEQELKKLNVSLAFRVLADPEWAIEKDVIFGGKVENGKLLALGFLSEGAARRESEFIMAAPPRIWKKVLRKEDKFLTDFMLGKITLEQGSKVGVLAIAPHANTFVNVLTQIPLQFPDEMTSEEIEAYRTDLNMLLEKLGS
jgi:hypothetical protein